LGQFTDTDRRSIMPSQQTRASRSLTLTACAAIALLAAAACDEPVTSAPDGPAFSRGAAASEAAQDALLKSVMQMAARYNSTQQALRDGYTPETHCVPHMGFHWPRFDLVDPVFAPLQPEVVLYAPGPSGKLQLVAVEYVVIDVGQPHPHFGDQPFDVGGTPIPVDHYSLHVWLFEDNPDGMFAAHNPNVSCS
jgi:hypothetical protein